MAQVILTKFKEHPQAWQRVDTILEHTQHEPTKLLALNILNDLISTRWKILPPEQRQAIKTYLINLMLKMSNRGDSRREESAVINNINKAIVQVILFYICLG